MKILKDKKGIALENTLLFMMIIFSLCFLIASFALIGHYQGKIENIRITQRVNLDQIGEDYLESVKNSSTDFDSEGYDGYTCEVNEGDRTLTVKNGETVVLYVKADSSGNPEVWRYSQPE